jgi:hypothetical protein
VEWYKEFAMMYGNANGFMGMGNRELFITELTRIYRLKTKPLDHTFKNAHQSPLIHHYTTRFSYEPLTPTPHT